MQSTMSPKSLEDSRDVLVVASDSVMMVPTDEELSKLARSMRNPANTRAPIETDVPAGPSIPAVDTTFRPSVDNSHVLRGRRRQAARKVTVAILLTACTIGAALAWQSHRSAAERMIARWAPERLASLLPLQKPSILSQSSPGAVEAPAANVAPQEPAHSAQNVPESIAPPAVAASVESPPAAISVENDVASVRQELEQLKASIEDIKASQHQISREFSRLTEAKASESRTPEVQTSEQTLRPKLPPHPRRTAATTARKPTPKPPLQPAAVSPALPQTVAPYVAQQAETQPQSRPEPRVDEELASVPRPPMPLR